MTTGCGDLRGKLSATARLETFKNINTTSGRVSVNVGSHQRVDMVVMVNMKISTGAKFHFD